MNISAATAERMVGGYREPTVRSPVFFVMLLLLVLVSFETFLAEILGVPLLASSSHAAIAPVFFILLMDLSKGVFLWSAVTTAALR